jgi:TP901 family phage tail tape measure protein
MALATVNLKFGVNVKDFQTKLDTVSKSSMQFGKEMTKIGKSMTTYLTAPLVGFAGLAGKVSMDFDDSMRKVQATSRASGDEMDLLRKKAQEMGATTRFSASESAEAMNYMALAGWKSSQILDALPSVLNLSAAAGEDLARISDIVTDGLTAFGKSASYATEFTDILAAASSNSNTTVGMLGESFKYVAPLAGSLGFAVEDTAVALGLMANAGIKGSQSGTALRSMMSRLVKPTAESKQAMEALGLSVTNADGTMKPLNQILTDIRASFAGMPPAQQAMNAGLLAGQEAMSGLLAITNASDEDFIKLNDNLYNAGGSAKTMAEVMEGGLGGAFRSLKSASEGLLIQFGEILTPALATMADVLRSTVNWFSELSTGVKTTMVVMGGLLAAVGPLLMSIGFFSTSILPALITGFKVLSVAALGVSAPILGIAAAVAAAGILIYKYWDEIKAYFQGPEVTGLMDSAKEMFASFKTYLVDFWNLIKPVVMAGFEFLKGVFGVSFKILGTYVKTFIDSAVIIFQTGFNIFSNLFKVFSGLFTGDWKKMWEGFKGIFTSLFQGIVRLLSTQLGNMSRLIGEFLQKLGINTLGDGMVNFADKMKTFSAVSKTALKEVKEEAVSTSAALAAVVSPMSTTPTGGGGGGGSINAKIPAMEITGSVDRALPDILNPDLLKTKLDAMKPILSQFTQMWVDTGVNLSEGFSDILNRGIMDGLSVFGEGIGALATGAASIGDIGKSLLGVLGGVMQQLGQLAIGAGLAVEGIKLALKSLNPVVAIAAGVGLIALSKVVTGSMKSMASGGSASSGGQLGDPSSVRGGRAMGGVVQGGSAYLVGERGPEIFTSGVSGYISPNSSLAGGGGMHTIHITGELRGNGRELFTVIDEYTNLKGRTT